jgi:hypothetical protein
MNSTSDTANDLRNICNTVCKTPKSDCYNNCYNDDCHITNYQNGCVPYQQCHKPQRYDPGICYFTSIITPLTDIKPDYSGCTGSVEFRMRRKNKTVTLQWESFTGTIVSIGIDKLTVVQSICNTPPYKIYFPIMVKMGGDSVNAHIVIDPYQPNNKGNIFFKIPKTTNENTIIEIYASCVSWIVD